MDELPRPSILLRGLPCLISVIVTATVARSRSGLRSGLCPRISPWYWQTARNVARWWVLRLLACGPERCCRIELMRGDELIEAPHRANRGGIVRDCLSRDDHHRRGRNAVGGPAGGRTIVGGTAVAVGRDRCRWQALSAAPWLVAPMSAARLRERSLPFAMGAASLGAAESVERQATAVWTAVAAGITRAGTLGAIPAPTGVEMVRVAVTVGESDGGGSPPATCVALPGVAVAITVLRPNMCPPTRIPTKNRNSNPTTAMNGTTQLFALRAGGRKGGAVLVCTGRVAAVARSGPRGTTGDTVDRWQRRG